MPAEKPSRESGGRQTRRSFGAGVPGWQIWGAYGLTLGLVLAGAGYLYGASKNHLGYEGRWWSGKMDMAMGLMGRDHFVRGTQALSRNRLNLGAWHGFQEVYYHQAVAAGEIRFRFLVEAGAYVSFLYDRDSAGSAGVRFSAAERFENARLVVGGDGGFLEKEGLGIGAVAAGRWHRCVWRRVGGEVIVSLDGEEVLRQGVAEGATTAAGKTCFGFRGGLRPAYIDDIEVLGADGAVLLEEGFSYRGSVRRAWTAAGGAMVLFHLMMAGVLRRRRQGWPAVGMWAILVNLLAAMGVAALIGFFVFVYADQYPMVGRGQQRTEQAWVAKRAKATSAYLEDRFGDGPAADEIRVLFVGTSQTWGAGARVLAETFVIQAERMWNEKYGGRGKVRCMTGGISGQNSTLLWERYSKEWIDLQPGVVVINLGTNDTNMEAFRANLGRFVELNEDRGIRTVFALEANSIEHRPGSLRQHATMRRVAEEKGVPVIDVHGLLKARYDAGFLWWDFVHPTSFGHRLIAEVFLQEIELGPDGARPADGSK